MARGSRSGGGSRGGSNRGGSGRSVSGARLSQKTGSNNSFGGYTKVQRSDGSFTMKKSGK